MLALLQEATTIKQQIIVSLLKARLYSRHLGRNFVVSSHFIPMRLFCKECMEIS